MWTNRRNYEQRKRHTAVGRDISTYSGRSSDEVKEKKWERLKEMESE